MNACFLPIDLPNSALIQAAIIGASTLVLEDPATIGAGLLVADGRISFATAAIGLFVGLVVGDLGLYVAGRFFQPVAGRWISVREEKVARAKRWLDRNMLSAVLLGRFIPGMRLATYTAAGWVGASWGRFSAAVVAASLVWTLLLLFLVGTLGGAVVPLLGGLKWSAAAAVLVLGVALPFSVSQLGGRRLAERSGRPRRAYSFYEFWPGWLFYLPVAAWWGWLSLRYRSLTLPTLANPSIPLGGLVGESKCGVLDLVSNPGRGFVAPYLAWVNRTASPEPGDAAECAARAVEAAGFTYPLIAKPDNGQRGWGVQFVGNREALRCYVNAFPTGQTIVFQQYVSAPMEAGVLYTRLPGESMGVVTSLTIKQFPSVTGDGTRTLRQLIEADPRAKRIRHRYYARHAARLDKVIPDGENVQLVFCGSHTQGAIFVNANDLITRALSRRFDLIARSMPDFRFGRFDVRFSSIDRFLEGEEFLIVEINGAGAESTHIWDAEMPITGAYRALFQQFDALFRIGAENRRRGFRPAGPIRLLREFFHYVNLSEHYPPSS